MSFVSRMRAKGIVKRNRRNGISNPYRATRYMNKISDDSTEWTISKYEQPITYPYCTCGHKVDHQYYLTHNDGESIILGSECVRRLKDPYLTSQLSILRMADDMKRDSINARVKYVKDISNGTPKYYFRVRYNSRLYNLFRFLSRKEYVYKPWRFDKKHDCYITVGHRHPFFYNEQWYTIRLSLYTINTVAGKYASFRYI